MIKKIENTVELYLIMFFPIWISIGGFIPIIETIVTFLFLFLLLSEQILKRKTIIKYILISILFFISGLMNPDISTHLDHIKPMIIIFLTIDARNSELYSRAYKHVETYSKFLTIQLIIVLIANILFMFFNIGYSNEYSGLWSLSAFRGIYSDPHQCAYHICALLIIFLIVAKKNSKMCNYILILGYLYCTCITGARIPTVLALFLGVIFFTNYVLNPFKKQRVESKLLKLLILLIIALLAVFLIMKFTSFGQKTVEALSNGSFDSGRSILRERDIELFEKGNIINKLFGYGSATVLEYHGSFKYSSPIWSHNDFLQILCGIGLLMFLCYVWQWIKLLVSVKRESFMSVFFVAILILVAFYNGLYIHTRLVFVIPLLLIFLKIRREENLKRTYYLGDENNEENSGSFM